MDRRRLAAAALVGLLISAQGGMAQDPLPAEALLAPETLAKTLKDGGKAPMIISVAFPVLYRSRHILHALDAGAASKPEGVEALRKLVADAPKDSSIVIYCGCCPMTKCPNVRPAFRALKEMGYTNIRVLNIPTNMHTDWYAKSYPSEPGVAAQ